MADKIVLDRETFKTLASEMRIGLLKKLDGKEVNLSDLSRELGMNKATLLEHLNLMIANDLVKRVEKEGQKFVYYKLTFKGSGILHPERTWVTVMLGVAVAALAGGFWSLISYLNPVQETLDNGGPLKATMESAPAESATNPVMMYVSIALFAVCVALIVFAAWFRRRKRLEMEKAFAEKVNSP